MAALTAAAVIGTVAAVASTVHSIEQSKQAQRAANQAKNGAEQDAEKALKQKAIDDAAAEEQKAANLARDNQRRRINSGGIGAVPLGMATPGATATPPPGGVGGGNTLLGS